MSTDKGIKHAGGRRETVARSAFYVWIAAYVVATIAIVTVHGLSGTPPQGVDSHARHDAALERLDPTPVGSIVPVARAGSGG